MSLSHTGAKHWRDLSLLANKGTKSFNEFLRDFYLTPLKGGEDEIFYVLNFTIRRPDQPDILTGDLRQSTLEAFWAHKKDIAPNAMQKVQNTESFLRFLKMRFPQRVSLAD